MTEAKNDTNALQSFSYGLSLLFGREFSTDRDGMLKIKLGGGAVVEIMG